jgi:signal transduction histidine kinase/ligand-binding sensor domain-containing protein
MRRLCSAFVVILIAGAAWAGEARREGVAAGAALPFEAVTALFQDRAGFLWVGSREGLAMFDGYTSTIFEHDVADPASLSDNAIRTVFEDRAGRLWIGTNTGGLDLLDRATWSFRSYRHDSADPKSISNDSVYAIAEDRGGRLWVGTQSGLDRFDPATGTFERLEAQPGGLSDPYVDALLTSSDGSLWVGTVGGGLNRLDPAKGTFKVFRHHAADPGTIAADEVFAIAEGASGVLYIGTGVGVDRFDPETGRAARVPFMEAGKARTAIVTSMTFSSDGTLWASTFDAGLWALAPRAGSFERRAYREATSGVVVDRLICALADRGGWVWVGTWGAGLARVLRGDAGFSSLEADGPGQKSALSETTAVLEDRAGNLWVGESNSLVRRDTSGRATRIDGLSGAVALRERRDGGILVGTASTFAEVDPTTHRIVARFLSGTAPKASLGPGWIWSVLEDRSGRVWIATGGGGLYRTRDDGTFDRFAHDPADPASLSDDYVVSLLESTNGTIWVGTRSGGLNVLPPGAASFTRCEPSASDPSSISHHSVSSLLEDRRGTIWVGTGGGGFNRVDRGPSGEISFTRFSERDGLIDDNVVCLIEDDDGSIWVGTRGGLSRFDPVSGGFASFAAEDGLPSVEFATGAATKGRTSLYFGTHRGVVAVRRGEPFPRSKPSPTVLTSVRTLSGPLAGNLPTWTNERLDVAYGESLTFELAVLDFGDRRRHRYAYRLEGLSNDWIDLGTRREVTLTHLDPGTYSLRAKGRNDQGVWSETTVALAIRVIPPFWMTAWFRTLVAAAIFGMVLAGHRFRTSALERRNRELVLLKEQREQALHEAHASQEELHHAYGRLRGLTRRLEAAKEEERKRIARELHDEMGQILTTAKLNLQLLPGTQAPEDRERRVGDAIGLLDRLIGHVRALSLDLRPPLLDELGLSAALRGYVEAQARRSGITIDLACDPVPTGIPNDVEIAAFRVVQEAITNVLRHAAARQVTVELRYDPGRFDLLISDDGRGFDVVAAFDRASAGSHLGLLGMKERVESMGGSMTIESTTGSGSTVRACILWEM